MAWYSARAPGGWTAKSPIPSARLAATTRSSSAGPMRRLNPMPWMPG